MTTTDLPAFDPAAITPEMLDGLTKDRLREVIAHHGIPLPPASTSKADVLRLARVTLTATTPAGALPAGPMGPAAAISADPDDDGPAVALEPRPTDVLPSLSKWQLIVQMGEYLAKANTTPEALRGRPNDVGSILLQAHDLGIPLMAGLTQLYVVHGKVGMEAKLMRALVRRDGHHLGPVEVDDPDYRAQYAGVRADTGDSYTAEFTLDDAQAMDLIAGYGRNDDGTITVRPVMSNGKSAKPQWVKQTRKMLKERACSDLCRELFSDCLAGVTYTPDELGFLDVDAADEAPRGRAGEDEPTMTVHQQQSEIAGRIEELPEDLKSELREAWKARKLQPPAKLTPAGIRTARALLEPVEAKARDRQADADAKIDDAELVDEDGGSDAGEPAAATDSGGSATETATDGGDADPGEGPDTASPAPPAATLTCTACGQPIGNGPPAFSDTDEPYHLECAPFV